MLAATLSLVSADRSRQLPPFTLGNPGPLRDRLVAAVLSGEKTATTSLRAEHGGEALPKAGQRLRLIDSSNDDVAVVEITAVETMSLADVSRGLAQAEGEGFSSVAEWRAAHEDFWQGDDYVAELGVAIDDATEIVVEYFRVVSP